MAVSGGRPGAFVGGGVAERGSRRDLPMRDRSDARLERLRTARTTGSRQPGGL